MKNINILLIEDDSFLSNIYGTKLREEGFSVNFAINGEEGLKKVKELKPDIVLLDILLPGIDGWEVLRQIEEDESLEDVKIVVLSNLDQSEENNEENKKRVSKHLVKAQYTPTDIIKEIKKLI